jgi:hypothetical protein
MSGVSPEIAVPEEAALSPFAAETFCSKLERVKSMNAVNPTEIQSAGFWIIKAPFVSEIPNHVSGGE